MKIRSRIFLGIFLIFGVGFYFLLDLIVDDLTPRYRESTEEPLVDAARILASLAAMTARDGQIDISLFRRAFEDTYSREFSAQIYNFEKTNVDYRVYITDALGTVIFDSDNGRDEGKDYSGWRDVSLTLDGGYGARTSRDTPKGPRYSVMYVGAPIIVGGETVGVLTVGKPTENANKFIESAKNKIIIAGTTTGAIIIAVALLISGRLTRPINALTEYAKTIRDGQRASLPRLGCSEIRDLGEAFEEMRIALEGKQYVENYVQTLTHEIKSPLSAIKGAVELIEEDMPPEQRAKFIKNIRGETKRISEIVEKLLLLSSLENRKQPLEEETIELTPLLHEIADSFEHQKLQKKLILKIACDPDLKLQGEKFLIRHAITNLLDNAIQFSPEGGPVEIAATRNQQEIEISVTDQGPGIPEYASDKVFDRFYSLKRPDTGHKSSGLGLSLVREVAALHRGDCTVNKKHQGGTLAKLCIPSPQFDKNADFI